MSYICFPPLPSLHYQTQQTTSIAQQKLLKSQLQQSCCSTLPHTYYFTNEDDIVSQNNVDSYEDKTIKELNNIRNKDNIIYMSQLDKFYHVLGLHYFDTKKIKIKLNDEDITKINFIINKIKKEIPDFNFKTKNNDNIQFRICSEYKFICSERYYIKIEKFKIDNKKLVKLFQKDDKLEDKINLYLKLKNDENFKNLYLRVVEDNKYEDLSYYYKIIE